MHRARPRIEIAFLPALAAALFSLGAAAPPPAPAPASPQWTPELVLRVKRIDGVRVSPDGSRVAFEVAAALMDEETSEWRSQIFLAPTATGPQGPQAVQLTRGEKPATAPAWSPDGRWIAFLTARSGTSNLWRIAADGGEAEQVTDEKGEVAAFKWSPDGKSIAFVMSPPKSEEQEKREKEKDDAQVVDADLPMARLYVLPAEPGPDGKRVSRPLSGADSSALGDPADFDWSPDGKSIAYTHQPTPKVDDWPRTDISVVDVAAGTVRPFASTPAAEAQPAWSPDGASIAYTLSDQPPTWGGTDRVVVAPAAGGEARLIDESWDRQPTLVGWTADGGGIIVAETWHTVDRLELLPAGGGSYSFLSPADLMVSSPTLNATRTRLGFVSQSSNRPPEAFTSSVAPFAAVAASAVQELPAVPLGRTEVTRWKSSDGREIEGLLTYPVGYRPGSRVPLLVVVHGGPAGVFVRSFDASRGAYPIAAFAAAGFAVLRPNVRGSSGYGHEFRYANYGDWGGGDYQDVLTGVDHLVEQGIADPERLGVMGWSYGGFMTSWILTHTHRFKAASVGAAVTDLVAFTGTADIPGFLPDYFGGELWETPEAWREHSPISHLEGTTTPTLILHGGADQRVPTSQGYELYTALKRLGVPVEMVVYPRQPHGLREPKLQLDAMRRNLEWFERWLKK